MIMSNHSDLPDSPGTRVFLIDDNPDFVKAAVDFLRRRPELVFVGTMEGGEQDLAQATTQEPQVVLIDLELPGLADLNIIPRLREMLPGVGIIALTLLDSRTYLGAARAAGAHVIVSKAKLVSDLLPAIRTVTQASPPPPRTEPLQTSATRRH
jgi:DNA-binding NarL/FixJ family response regulator